MHYQFNVKVVHTLTHLILPGHPTLPFEGFRGKYSVGQAHTYPCGQVYDFDRREGVARPESKHQIIIMLAWGFPQAGAHCPVGAVVICRR